MKNEAVEATWVRLEHHVEQVEAAVRDLREAVRRRSVPFASGAIQVLATRAFDAARLLGRLDQDLEDRNERG